MVSFARLAELEEQGAPYVVATVVRVTGSTPRSAGARMLIHADGRLEGTIGGGRVEHEVVGMAPAVLDGATCRLVEFELVSELGMCCGGSMSVFLEPESGSSVASSGAAGGA